MVSSYQNLQADDYTSRERLLRGNESNVDCAGQYEAGRGRLSIKLLPADTGLLGF